MQRSNDLLHPIKLADPAPKKIALICFPHAGGCVANYSYWVNSLPNYSQLFIVDLPLRGKKNQQPMYDDIVHLVQDLYTSLEAHQLFSGGAYLFFGHSFGARLAFELLTLIQRQRQPKPCHIIVSGCRAPNFPPQTYLHNADDEVLTSQLYQMGGIPDELLNDRQLLAFFTPAIRADLKLLETYTPSQTVITDCDVSVFSGVEDYGVEHHHRIDWQNVFTRRINHYQFAGNHFFIKSQQTQVLNTLCAIIASYKLDT